MYNSLTGILSGKTAGKVFLDVGGVEWELDASYLTVGNLPETGRKVRVYTHLHHRDDIMRLYGFGTEEERSLFLELLKVDGIGPKQALRILSGTDVDAFIAVLEAGDIDALTRIPGIGIKSAQKIILALKGRLSFSNSEESDEETELTAALAEMGFDRKKAAAAVKSLTADLKDSGLPREAVEKEIFRRAIVLLSG